MNDRPSIALPRNKQIVAGFFILIFVLLAAILAPWIVSNSPYEQDLLARRQTPSSLHPFGLDELGRDNLSRVVYGARLSLWVGVSAVSLAVTAGVILGTLAGYSDGWLDGVIMSITDVMLAFPTLLLAIVMVAALGRGLTNVVYALAFAAVPTYTRLVRLGVLVTKEKEYVLAAQSIGSSPLQLIVWHILPNCLVPLFAQAPLGIGTAILEAAGLSFLGLGAQPPMPEWGAMIAEGRGAVFAAPHIMLFPGLAIILTVLGFNLFGDGLQRLMDPRAK